MTIEQVNAFLLDNSRTVEELSTLLGVIKGRLDEMSSTGETASEFADANAEFESRAKAKLGIER
jgi:hypothetical protein